MISNDVLEWELNNINQKIASFTSKKQKPPEELIVRKEHTQMSLNVLSLKVETGQLTQVIIFYFIK